MDNRLYYALESNGHNQRTYGTFLYLPSKTTNVTTVLATFFPDRPILFRQPLRFKA